MVGVLDARRDFANDVGGQHALNLAHGGWNFLQVFRALDYLRDELGALLVGLDLLDEPLETLVVLLLAEAEVVVALTLLLLAQVVQVEQLE